jgi:hypothetical protein
VGEQFFLIAWCTLPREERIYKHAPDTEKPDEQYQSRAVPAFKENPRPRMVSFFLPRTVIGSPRFVRRTGITMSARMDSIRFLLSHPEIAARLGESGHQHVKENFLITQNLKRYLTQFLTAGAK